DVIFQKLSDPVLVPKPFESSCRENDSIELAGIQFAEACIDIAAKRQQIEGRESMTQLDLTSQAACPDRCSGTQLLKFGSLGQEGVARIFAFRNRAKIDAVRKLERDVLKAVNREIDAAVEKRLVQFLCEQTLSTDFGEGDIENLISGRFDPNQF